MTSNSIYIIMYGAWCAHCTLTLDSLAEVVSKALLLDDVLVDLARGDVVVAVQSDVKETLIVAEVKVHLTTVIQHKHLT